MMIILRGVAGSGKSTLAQALAEKYEDSVICSADDFFMLDGEWVFILVKLKIWNQVNFLFLFLIVTL